MTISPDTIQRFRGYVEKLARQNPRDLPWRRTTDPYRIMVSEVMLQQTQVDRVIPRYLSFIDRFPDLLTLADAPLSELLGQWQGLGYNRRGVMLKGACQLIRDQHQGVVPSTREELRRLPGIGDYTAGAILAFAFDRPEPFIETNIRSLFIHYFFPFSSRVHDREILPLVTATLDRDSPRRWYNLLMDAGAFLKKQGENPSRRSTHHQRQSPFDGSNRQLRSQILRIVLATPGVTLETLREITGKGVDPIRTNLGQMEREGMIVQEAEGGWRVP
ncbi:MAG: endonuclease III [Desulfuromonadia bacterium]